LSRTHRDLKDQAVSFECPETAVGCAATSRIEIVHTSTNITWVQILLVFFTVGVVLAMKPKLKVVKKGTTFFTHVTGIGTTLNLRDDNDCTLYTD
jgi:hypothetical protein